MKTPFAESPTHARFALALAFALAVGLCELPAIEKKPQGPPMAPSAPEEPPPPHHPPGITIEAIELLGFPPGPNHPDGPWLGVSTVEAPEALASQLDLPAGTGLVVTYVAPESPAAKAGLRKNDLLIQLDDQSLVHPAQLRKLVQVRQPGDSLELTFLRAGKKETLSATLAKAEGRRFGAGIGPRPWLGELENLKGLENLRALKDLHLDEPTREHMKALKEHLGHLQIDQRKLELDIRHSMEDARKALREALRSMTNADPSLEPLRKALQKLASSGWLAEKPSTVTVRSSDRHERSLIQTDESGRIVIVSDPKLHLTAHDKDGELIFDGPIDTQGQRSKVPSRLWSRVKPLVDKLQADKAGHPEAAERE